MKKRRLQCVICGVLLNPNDMDHEWCNNCLRKHLEKNDPSVKPRQDNKQEVKPNGKRSN
jgi:hypothetical protein